MAEPDMETDLDAAERALGVAPPDGAESAEARAARRAWDARLAPLNDDAAPVAPPAAVWARIEAALGREAAMGEIADLAAARRALRRWRGAALAAGALAAGLALMLAAPRIFPTPAPAPAPAPQYVAVVTSDDDGATGLVIHFDPASGLATLIPTGLVAPEARSLEMWRLPEGAERPLSLGLLPDGPDLRLSIEAAPRDLFAISLEPPGGSPNGAPTQPIYHGRMIEIE